MKASYIPSIKSRHISTTFLLCESVGKESCVLVGFDVKYGFYCELWSQKFEGHRRYSMSLSALVWISVSTDYFIYFSV